MSISEIEKKFIPRAIASGINYSELMEMTFVTAFNIIKGMEKIKQEEYELQEYIYRIGYINAMTGKNKRIFQNVGYTYVDKDTFEKEKQELLEIAQEVQ